MIELLKKIEYVLRKDSLTDGERIMDALTAVRAAISTAEAIPTPAQAPQEPLSLQAVREDERLACWKIADKERTALKNADPDKAAWLVAFDIANAIKARGYSVPSTNQLAPAPHAEVREALEWYAQDYNHELGCSQWDGGAKARAALATLAPHSLERGEPGRPLCSCKASERDGQHMMWCSVSRPKLCAGSNDVGGSND